MVHQLSFFACAAVGFAAGWIVAVERQRYLRARAAVDELRSVVDAMKRQHEVRGRFSKGGDA